jgi:hypothetical protein
LPEKDKEKAEINVSHKKNPESLISGFYYEVIFKLIADSKIV